MKKKSLLAGGFMLAMVAATGGYHAFTSNSSLEGNLLMENVEALSKIEEGGSKGCSTSVVYVNNVIPCPLCGGKTGQVGVSYSCKSKGSDTTCQEGFRGTRTSCTPYHGSTENVNDVVTIDC